MKITVVCVFVGVLAAFVCDSSAQIGGPGLGWAIGQQASVNAVSLAIDGALAKADPATLPPELQVSDTKSENRSPNLSFNFPNFPSCRPVCRRNFNKFWKMPSWRWPLVTIYWPRPPSGATKSVNSKNCRKSRRVCSNWSWKPLLQLLPQFPQSLNQLVNQMMDLLTLPNQLNVIIDRIVQIVQKELFILFKIDDETNGFLFILKWRR